RRHRPRHPCGRRGRHLPAVLHHARQGHGAWARGRPGAGRRHGRHARRRERTGARRGLHGRPARGRGGSMRSVLIVDDEPAVRATGERATPENGSGRAKGGEGAAPRRRPILTRDPALQRVLAIAESVASSRAPVLIQGESGTGKELLARYVHESGSRRGKPFVAVNCAALPRELLESELFGHERGAFTGAITRKTGKFELASGGTILLDEISEMELGLQAKLLRVLQEYEVDRVGGSAPVPVDVRVVATTNRRLAEMVDRGRFREDLYYRLTVIPLVLPPLRERPADIDLLADHFLDRFSAGRTLRLAPEAREALKARPWPGNVRELENTLERAALLARSEVVTAGDLDDRDAGVPRLAL